MEMRSQENFLMHVLNSGFNKAATSFSRLINRPVKIINSQSILVRHDEDFSYVSEEQGELYVLVTQVIGDISGKSFLIFNHEESQEIFRALNTSITNEVLNEAFLLEIDNIISASVIAELSDTLNLEIYGDVPQLAKIQSQHLHKFMTGETSKDEPSSMIFSNTTFQFDQKDKIHPQFIWKISSKVFDLISVDKTTSKAV
jgi:chemotaxis protein CheY-P-specific phosphatase CheC